MMPSAIRNKSSAGQALLPPPSGALEAATPLPCRHRREIKLAEALLLGSGGAPSGLWMVVSAAGRGWQAIVDIAGLVDRPHQEGVTHR
jgi:hypothetical protein